MDPTPAPAPAPTPAPAPAPTPAPAPAAFDWKTSGLNDADVGYIGTKGWKSPGDLLNSYRNAEKHIGAPPDSIIKIPSDDKPESWGPVFDRLGRPKAPAEYKLPVPEGQDGKFAEQASTWFHEAGLTTKQATALATKWNEHMAGFAKTQNEQVAAAVAAEQGQLRVAWGANHDANTAVAKKAAQAFGLKPETIDTLQKGVGYAEVMKFFHAVGSKIGTEGGFHTGGGPGNFVATPEAAKARIAELKADKAWIQKWSAGDADARKLMNNLQVAAFGQGG